MKHFNPVLIDPVSPISLDRLHTSLDTIDKGNKAAENANIEIAKMINDFDFNTAEDEFKQQLYNDTNKIIQDNMIAGNMHYAYDKILGQIKNLYSNPLIKGKLNNQKDWKAYQDNIAKANISEIEKDYYRSNNPYESIIKTDDNGNIVGTFDWKPKQEIIPFTPPDQVIQRVKHYLSSQRGGGGTSYMYLDANGRPTSDFSKSVNGEIYSQTSNGTWEKLPASKIMAAINDLIETDPALEQSLRREYEVKEWGYGKDKYNGVIDDIFNSDGTFKNYDRWVQEKFIDKARFAEINNYTNGSTQMGPAAQAYRLSQIMDPDDNLGLKYLPYNTLVSDYNGLLTGKGNGGKGSNGRGLIGKNNKTLAGMLSNGGIDVSDLAGVESSDVRSANLLLTNQGFSNAKALDYSQNTLRNLYKEATGHDLTANMDDMNSDKIIRIAKKFGRYDNLTPNQIRDLISAADMVETNTKAYNALVKGMSKDDKELFNFYTRQQAGLGIYDDKTSSKYTKYDADLAKQWNTIFTKDTDSAIIRFDNKNARDAFLMDFTGVNDIEKANELISKYKDKGISYKDGQLMIDANSKNYFYKLATALYNSRVNTNTTGEMFGIGTPFTAFNITTYDKNGKLIDTDRTMFSDTQRAISSAAQTGRGVNSFAVGEDFRKLRSVPTKIKDINKKYSVDENDDRVIQLQKLPGFDNFEKANLYNYYEAGIINEQLFNSMSTALDLDKEHDMPAAAEFANYAMYEFNKDANQFIEVPNASDRVSVANNIKNIISKKSKGSATIKPYYANNWINENGQAVSGSIITYTTEDGSENQVFIPGLYENRGPILNGVTAQANFTQVFRPGRTFNLSNKNLNPSLGNISMTTNADNTYTINFHGSNVILPVQEAMQFNMIIDNYNATKDSFAKDGFPKTLTAEGINAVAKEYAKSLHAYFPNENVDGLTTIIAKDLIELHSK